MVTLGLKLSAQLVSFNEEEFTEINGSLFKNELNHNFDYFVFFKYLNYMIEKGHLVYFSEYLMEIEARFMQAVAFNRERRDF